jgi:hypothetical protein
VGMRVRMVGGWLDWMRSGELVGEDDNLNRRFSQICGSLFERVVIEFISEMGWGLRWSYRFWIVKNHMSTLVFVIGTQK